jgi:hypothetical protein
MNALPSSSIATPSDVEQYAGEIYQRWTMGGSPTLAEAGAAIEAEMDGTQPHDLIDLALALAKSWRVEPS